ncbi:hypothetical protein GS399_16945 [Pedobacter sp. HMF7647]|uniref:Uncharacterized protein n=1 Tax=Hufsiella arboris TaxID=2695275 RepID=A0A7K1YDI8_9SPHI|nr:hypothetical protein [Hufsiella arboris]MXV52664.1 hypothetical protein [Hufsiella arboris]
MKTLLTSKITLVILFLLTFSTAMCKESDFYVNVKQDTVWGSIKATDNTWIKFKEENKADYEKISIDQIKEYYKSEDKTHCYAMTLPGSSKPKFLALLEEGAINLYEVSSFSNAFNTTSNIVQWYTSKNNSTLEEVKANLYSVKKSKDERNEVFYDLFKDDYELFYDVKKFANLEFGQMREWIKKYNDKQYSKDRLIAQN